MSRVLASSAALCALGTLVAPSAAADPIPVCGPDQATAVGMAIDREQHDRLTQAPWNPAPVGGSNFDSCANLSVVVVSIDNPRPNSPRQAFLFHQGTYIGTATTASRPFTTLDTAKSTKDAAVLNFTSGKTCSSCNDGKVIPVRYYWNGATVVMADPYPPPQTWPVGS
ncbi:MAG TPA: LppP/LprE family lipoprotein [Mycobacterium sp.]